MHKLSIVVNEARSVYNELDFTDTRENVTSHDAIFYNEAKWDLGKVKIKPMLVSGHSNIRGSRGIAMCFALHYSACTACSLSPLFFRGFYGFPPVPSTADSFDKKTGRS